MTGDDDGTYHTFQKYMGHVRCPFWFNTATVCLKYAMHESEDLAQSGHLVQGGHTVGGPPVKLVTLLRIAFVYIVAHAWSNQCFNLFPAQSFT